VTLGPATVLFALPELDEKLEAMLLKNQKRRNDTEEMLAEMRRIAASSPGERREKSLGEKIGISSRHFFSSFFFRFNRRLPFSFARKSRRREKVKAMSASHRNNTTPSADDVLALNRNQSTYCRVFFSS
jgi:hypothetical protein